jgi:hypothetical protein
MKRAKKKVARTSRGKFARPSAKKASKRGVKKASVSLPPGYGVGPIANLLLPRQTLEPVKPSKMRQGIAAAKKQLDETLDELLRTMTGDYEIKEIKLIASFNADGKFLGFGVGGAASMEITIQPCADE